MRYLITFSYDGTKFHGFQRQKDCKNVQGTIEKVLSDVLKEEIVIKGSGRTDAGVHAYNQCAHFDTTTKFDKKVLKKANEIFNNEIVIKKYRMVTDNFHARYSVKEKTYIYKINIGTPKKEYDGYYYQSKFNYDIKAMKKACKVFEGTHDFHNFVGGYRDDYISTIFKINLNKKKEILTFTFEGVGFYRYMVRHLVGAILNVGKHKNTIDDLVKMLETKDEMNHLPVAPAEGLYLVQVKY